MKGQKGKIDVDVPQLLEGSVCGALLDLDVAVKETKKGAKDGSGTVTLSAQVKKNKDEGIDRETMFYAYTRNAARAIGLEQQIGSLAPGKQADLIVLDRDVFQVPQEQLAQTQVLKTYFAGREVYSRP